MEDNSSSESSIPANEASSDVSLDVASKLVLMAGAACSGVLAIGLAYVGLRAGLFILRKLAES